MVLELTFLLLKLNYINSHFRKNDFLLKKKVKNILFYKLIMLNFLNN